MLQILISEIKSLQETQSDIDYVIVDIVLRNSTSVTYVCFPGVNTVCGGGGRAAPRLVPSGWSVSEGSSQGKSLPVFRQPTALMSLITNCYHFWQMTVG